MSPTTLRCCTLSLAITTALAAQADWTNITATAGSPHARYHHGMAFDRARNAAVLFGGYRQVVGLNAETWEFAGGTWTQRAPAVSPPPAYGCLLVYDRMRNHCLLFGGWTGAGGYSNQTWRWDGTNWTQLQTAGAPSPRYFPGVVYDPSTGNTLLFGGYDGGVHVNDTWQWNGSTWTQLVPTGQIGQPPGRRGPGMAWDEQRNVAVMFGGFIQFSPNAIAFADTWEWNGGWVQRLPATVPPVRAHQGMDYDAFRGRTVMHGGDAQSLYRTDTWEWNGSDWTQRAIANVPGISTAQGMVYDPAQRRMLMHGGVDTMAAAIEQTWTYATSQPASFTLYGAGCGPSWVPGLACAEADLPWTGSAGLVQLTQVPAGRPALIVVGLDDVGSPFGPLPFDLGGLGAPGCSLLANPMVTTFLGVVPVSWSTGVLPAFAAGVSLYVQAGVLEPSANALGAAVSPGGRLVVGAR